MNSWNGPAVPIKIFSIVTLSLGFCCLFLCCCGCILSKKKNKKQNQIHFTNNQHSSEAHSHIFTIEMPGTQSSNTTIIDSSYLHLSNKPPLTNESIKEPLAGQYS
jgi:hypothetical protein